MKSLKVSTLKTALFAVLSTSLTLAFNTNVQAEDAASTNAPTPWVSSAAAGVTLTRGNSHTFLGTLNLQTERKNKVDEYLFGADVSYGDNQGVTTTETYHGFGQYNRFASGNLYYGVRLDGLRDGIAAIRYRLTLAPLVGYYLIKNTNDTLSVEAGPGFVYQDLLGVKHGFVTLRLGERYEHKFSDRAKLWQSFEILPQVDKFENYYVNAEIGLESSLTKRTSLRTYLQDTYYHIPAAGRQKNDLKLVAAIAYKF